MLTSIRGYLLAVGVFVLPACSTVSVTTDFDRSASFAQDHSYILDPSLAKIGLSPSSETALREETTENADLHIVRHISAQEKLMVHQSSAGVPYRYGRYGMWTGAPYYYTDVSQYTEGTLILDFVDAKTQKLVFRGVGTGTVSDPETNADRIKQAVEKIVQGYPSAVGQ